MIEPDFKMNRKPFSAYGQDELRALMMRDARGNKPPPQHREYAGAPPQPRPPRRCRNEMARLSLVAMAFAELHPNCDVIAFAEFAGVTRKVARLAFERLIDARVLRKTMVKGSFRYTAIVSVKRGTSLAKSPWEART